MRIATFAFMYAILVVTDAGLPPAAAADVTAIRWPRACYPNRVPRPCTVHGRGLECARDLGHLRAHARFMAAPSGPNFCYLMRTTRRATRPWRVGLLLFVLCVTARTTPPLCVAPPAIADAAGR